MLSWRIGCLCLIFCLPFSPFNYKDIFVTDIKAGTIIIYTFLPVNSKGSLPCKLNCQAINAPILTTNALLARPNNHKTFAIIFWECVFEGLLCRWPNVLRNCELRSSIYLKYYLLKAQKSYIDLLKSDRL